MNFIIQCNTCGAQATVAPSEPCVEAGCSGTYICEVLTPASYYAEHMGRRELDDAWRCDEALALLDNELEAARFVPCPPKYQVRLGWTHFLPLRLRRLANRIRGNR